MIKPINGYTKQTMIDRVMKYNNGTKAVSEYDTCLYKTKDGNRCAIGCFIPDDHPGLNLTGGVKELLKMYPDLRQHMPIDSHLVNFQQIHDSSIGNRVRSDIINWINDNVDDNA